MNNPFPIEQIKERLKYLTENPSSVEIKKITYGFVPSKNWIKNVEDFLNDTEEGQKMVKEVKEKVKKEFEHFLLYGK